jgi:hypothetical protein
MPQTRKIITPKGSRYPGSGRPKGKPNPISVEVRALVGELVGNVNYQMKLRADFQARKVHPTIEALIWNYHLGKPRQDIQLAATIDMDVNARLTEEKRIFAQLDVRELETLAAESQALVDRAMALVKVRADAAIPQPVVVEPDLPIVSVETLGKVAGSDNTSYVNQPESLDDIPITPTDSEG